MDARLRASITTSSLLPPAVCDKDGTTSFARLAGCLRPGCAPCVANRRAIEALRFEQAFGRRQMLLALPNVAAPGQRGQQDFVDMPVEGRNLQPPFQIGKCLVIANAFDEMLQQSGLTAAEASPLGDKPAVEDRTAVDLQALQKIAVEQDGQCSLPVCGASVWMPLSVARAISIASTKQSDRSSRTVSSRVWTRWRLPSSTRLLILLRHQRSSPRGSLGTSHSSSQSWLLDTASGARARYAKSARTLRERGSASATPSRTIVMGPSIRTWNAGSAPDPPGHRIPRTFPRRLPRSAPRLAVTVANRWSQRAIGAGPRHRRHRARGATYRRTNRQNGEEKWI